MQCRSRCKQTPYTPDVQSKVNHMLFTYFRQKVSILGHDVLSFLKEKNIWLPVPTGLCLGSSCAHHHYYPRERFPSKNI